ncbi:CRISPR-associated endonuclease Cas2 [Treponema sp. J25]|uniref:CRISPR-associated endonuclease Cas2 n=1 Tax=Treponema sp. J25 TaxID=2094121 RepID=UPI00104A11ED|nr:CRISPR-associated endonuclease Cas2 [Treponema sp. J25]TCW61803.1 CRISPR-associated endonuclease Cas2 [Treponema sp. J25]
MYVILVYDISTETKEGRKRLPKVMKKCREYLHHTQKSVFEGEITEANFTALKTSIERIINDKEDYVVFYRLDNKNNLRRENIGLDFDPTANIL